MFFIVFFSNKLIFEIKCVITKQMRESKIKMTNGQIEKIVSPLNNLDLDKVRRRKISGNI